MNQPEDEFVYCCKCPENGRTGEQREKCRKEELEKSQWANWTCPKCAWKSIGLELIDYIKTRISVTNTEDEDGCKFVFRELLQNADDVKSNILVLRFEEDALYVANDGRAFTTTSAEGKLSDFEKISRVLGRHQAEDKDVVGHFGSGFQTVYRITNSPEVHSSGRFGRMSPARKEWDYNVEKRTSPYLHKRSKGVLFRLPWRDDEQAREKIDGVRVFEDENYWPRWDKQKIRELFEDLREYIHQAILCCQHLKTVRLIWHDNNKYEGFQVSRNFTLRIEDSETLKTYWSVGSVKQGVIEPKDWKDEWNESFQIEGWDWRKENCSYDYLVGSKNVTENGKRVFFGKKADGSVTITPNKDTLEKELKRGDLHILFPLFDVPSVFRQGDGRAFLYSVIPLPRRGKNKFIFSGRFFPTEDRKDVDVEGYGGVSGEWYQCVMLNIIELYESLFTILLEQIQKIETSEEVRQTIILNSIPAASLQEWMRPGRESQIEWARRSGEIFDRLVSLLVEKPILFSDGKWIKPKDAYWAQGDDEKSVVMTMGGSVFSEHFINHGHFKETLSSVLENRKVDLRTFNILWGNFKAGNADKSGNLIYNQKLRDGRTLNKSAIDSLIKFCLTRLTAWKDTIQKAVVPGKDGVLRSIEDYPVLPKQLDFLYEILPDSRNIHNDFNTVELQSIENQKRTVTHADNIIFEINAMAEKNPIRFENMNEKDHLAISKALHILVEEMDLKLREGFKDCRFIPYKIGKVVSLGKPNVRVPGKELIIGKHAGENYQRDSIFGTQKTKVPGLTPEVKARIKFLSLIDCEDEAVLEHIEDALSLQKLMEKDTPLNFVRHFLSPRHESLFIDPVLRDFLNIDDVKKIEEQKKQFQEALKLYFKEGKKTEDYLTPEDMSKVPCLCDAQGHWHSAGDFALNLEPELEILGCKSLHKDLQEWPREVLVALGVVESPNCSQIVDAIIKLGQKKGENREKLGSIIVWLLTSDVPIDTEFDKVKNLSVVPTTNGGYGRPIDVLIPTSKNKKILGDDFGGFLDFSSCSRTMTERVKTFEESAKKERLESLGLRFEPGLSAMLSVVRDRRRANREPPTELFEALSKEVDSDEQRSHDLIRGKSFGYYLNGMWVDSSQIRIMDKKTVAKEIADILIILPVGHRHSRYLLIDGADTSLSPEDILQPLLEKKVVPSLSIWDELAKLCSLIEEEHKEVYGKEPIYCFGEHQVCPQNIICIESDEDNLFLKEGPIGEFYVIGRLLTQKHGEALRKLGAKGGSQLDRNAITILIRWHKVKDSLLNADEVSAILHLIKRMKTLDSQGLFPDEALWPAEKDGQVVWMKPRLCYVKDSPLSRYFEKDLSFICLKIDGKVDVSLKDYAIASGCKAFVDCLKMEGGIEIENCEEDSRGAYVYKELANALSQYFSSLPNSGCFEWLKNVEGRRCGKIIVHYSISGIKTMVDRAALVGHARDSRWVISSDYQSPQAKRMDQLTEDIANTCAEQGFPDSEVEKLQSLIYKLLTCKVEEWSYHVEDYKPVNPIPTEFTIVEPVEPLPVHGTFQTLKEVWALDSLEMNEAGYADTKNTLQSWYHSCQICGNRTPSDEYGYTTSETLKRVVCSRGGRYKGEPMGFSTDNSVLLCPTHQVLWVRGLVKFSELEKSSEEVIRRLQQRIEDFEKKVSENPQESVPWECEVFEGKSKAEAGVIKGSWEKREIEFRAEHLVGFLKTMHEYLEKKKSVEL